ncbi:MAG: hypothetical protein ACLUNV_03440 [Sutterella wadsworthensis]
MWLLLLPRDYLSTFLKIGTIGALRHRHRLRDAELPHAGLHGLHPRRRPDRRRSRSFRSSSSPSPAVRSPGFHATIGTGTTPEDDRQRTRRALRRATAPC